MIGVWGKAICNLDNILLIHVTSVSVCASDLNSASVEEGDTTLCLLDFQETNEWPKQIHHPSVLLSSVQVVQSTLVSYQVQAIWFIKKAITHSLFKVS